MGTECQRKAPIHPPHNLFSSSHTEIPTGAFPAASGISDCLVNADVTDVRLVVCVSVCECVLLSWNFSEMANGKQFGLNRVM